MKFCLLLNSFSAIFNNKNTVIMKTIDAIIEQLQKDIECSQFLLNWIINRIDDIENKGNTFDLIKEDVGYMLNEYKDFTLIDSSMYFYISFI